MAENVTPEEFLRQAKQIFEEREELYRSREAEFAKKNAELRKELENIAVQKEEMEALRKDLDDFSDELLCKQENLIKGMENMKRRERELVEKECQLDDRERNIILKYNLELERVQNEEMKLHRLMEEYEYKLSLLDNGVMEKAEVFMVPEVPVNRDMSVPAETEVIRKGDSEVQDKKPEGCETGNENRGEVNGVEERMRHKTYDIPRDKADDELRDAYTREELTADVLENYLKKNEPHFYDVEIRHTDNGDLLFAKCSSLEYYFTFSEPFSFDITAKRKYDSRLKHALANYNSQYPDVQFTYDKKEKKVYATAYFSRDMSAYNLMQLVKKVNDCFSKNR